MDMIVLYFRALFCFISSPNQWKVLVRGWWGRGKWTTSWFEAFPLGSFFFLNFFLPIFLLKTFVLFFCTSFFFTFSLSLFLSSFYLSLPFSNFILTHIPFFNLHSFPLFYSFQISSLDPLKSLPLFYPTSAFILPHLLVAFPLPALAVHRSLSGEGQAESQYGVSLYTHGDERSSSH